EDTISGSNYTARDFCFSYDALNRLATAKELRYTPDASGNLPAPNSCTTGTPTSTTAWSITYAMDRFGNLRSGDGPLNPPISAPTNRIDVVSAPRYSYDYAGNLTGMPVPNSTQNHTYAY